MAGKPCTTQCQGFSERVDFQPNHLAELVGVHRGRLMVFTCYSVVGVYPILRAGRECKVARQKAALKVEVKSCTGTTGSCAQMRALFPQLRRPGTGHDPARMIARSESVLFSPTTRFLCLTRSVSLWTTFVPG